MAEYRGAVLVLGSVVNLLKLINEVSLFISSAQMIIKRACTFERINCMVVDSLVGQCLGELSGTVVILAGLDLAILITVLCFIRREETFCSFRFCLKSLELFSRTTVSPLTTLVLP